MSVSFSGIYANILFHQQLYVVAMEANSSTCSTIQHFSVSSVYENMLALAYDDSWFNNDSWLLNALQDVLHNTLSVFSRNAMKTVDTILRCGAHGSVDFILRILF